MSTAHAEAASSLAEFPARDRRKLFRQLLGGFVVFMAAVLRSSQLENESAFVLGCIICVLSVLPALQWARQMPYAYPFFEIFMATNLTSFGVPLVWESENVELFSNEVRTTAAICVIVFQLTAMAAFYGLRFRTERYSFWSEPLFRSPSPKWLLGGIVATAAYVLVTTYIWYPSAAVAGLLRASTAGMGTACTFLICYVWGQRGLRLEHKAIFVAAIATLFAVWSASLVLRQGASLMLIGLAGYFFGRRRVPWVPTLACFALFAVLHLGKYHMRAVYWFGDTRTSPGLADLPRFYSEWIDAGIDPTTPEQADKSHGVTLVERTSLMQMLCLVVALSPDPKPFLGGETYWHTLGQFVPRALWPEKPRGHLSTYTLGIYYGLQTEEATHTTTIAFGFLPEAWANFGLVGGVVIGIFFGAAFKLLALYSRHSPLLSYGGLLVVMVTAWSFQTELTMSIWLTSLFQGVVATIATIWVLRTLFRTE